ncbi:MAG: phosphogluconate dehydrogenase (NAD(+)-dependent, decarboxylating) [Candidatus Dojkabacteria bacterium]
MQIGFIGLGNMGLNMVKNLIDHGHELIVWNRSPEPRQEAAEYGATAVDSIMELAQKLTGKKVIFSMISAGSIVDTVLFDNGENAIIQVLGEGDIFIDGVNSHYKDSIRRAEKLKEHGILMLDAGVSGGVDGARNGACAMVGGDEEAFKHVEQLFKDMTVERGYGYFGTNGSGHFVKMVHNAIEYGMMQAIAEGLNLINESEFKPDLKKVLDVWNHGSIIESNLVGFLSAAVSKIDDINTLDPEIGALGTGMWASIDALERGVPFTTISHAVFNRYQSRKTGEYAFRMIQAMRAEFGAHTSKEREK